MARCPDPKALSQVTPIGINVNLKGRTIEELQVLLPLSAGSLIVEGLGERERKTETGWRRGVGMQRRRENETKIRR